MFSPQRASGSRGSHGARPVLSPSPSRSGAAGGTSASRDGEQEGDLPPRMGRPACGLPLQSPTAGRSDDSLLSALDVGSSRSSLLLRPFFLACGCPPAPCAPRGPVRCVCVCACVYPYPLSHCISTHTNDLVSTPLALRTPCPRGEVWGRGIGPERMYLERTDPARK